MGWNTCKVDKLLGDIEGIKRYIYNILVLSKYIFEKHIEQLRIIFGILRAAGLKVNTPKCIFGFKYIPYLGYVITREVIKPDPKIVQGMMDLRRPATTTEARALLLMVQYYRDMWPRRSHISAPMTEASRGRKGRRILWNGALESSFKELNSMSCDHTILSYPDYSQFTMMPLMNS